MRSVLFYVYRKAAAVAPITLLKYFIKEDLNMEHSKALNLMGKKISFIFNGEALVGFVIAVLKKMDGKEEIQINETTYLLSEIELDSIIC